MANLTKGYTFGATEEVTATKLHTLVDSGTVSNIVAADITDGVITDVKLASVGGAKFVTLGSVPAGAGVIPAANLTSVAQKGANSDITSLSGLTTALSVAQGGTGSYEEGDWTAEFRAMTSGTITINGSYQSGHYVKMGNIVMITGYFLVDSVSSPVGILNITGLPFANGNAFKYGVAVTVEAGLLINTATTSIMGRIDGGASVITLHRFEAGALNNLSAHVQANSYFFINATYFTD